MISEWVILQILSNSHKYSMLLEWQAQKKWQDMAAVAGRRDAVGMRVGILGYGSIGRQVGRVCAAMGMDVVAYTSRPRATASSRRDTGYVVPGTGDIDGTIPSQWFSGSDTASLHRFLGADLDILLVSIPLTKGTRQLLAAPEFRILGKKRNALVINISRGGILNQDDLVRYCRMPLEEGGLRGAALDVTDPEPLPPSSELWEVGNVVITPHISGLSREYLGR
jgi:phosphoglycerate dehydrogenase-like enzyme